MKETFFPFCFPDAGVLNHARPKTPFSQNTFHVTTVILRYFRHLFKVLIHNAQHMFIAYLLIMLTYVYTWNYYPNEDSKHTHSTSKVSLWPLVIPPPRTIYSFWLSVYGIKQYGVTQFSVTMTNSINVWRDKSYLAHNFGGSRLWSVGLLCGGCREDCA